MQLSPAAFDRRRANAFVGTFGGETMGTTWSARIVDPPAGAQPAILAVLAEVIGQMSHWDASSQLSRVNDTVPGQWHRIAPPFGEVMATAFEVAEKSGGAFDPAMGALVDLWGFGPPGPRVRPPDASEVAAARAVSGRTALEFDPLLLRLRRTRAARLDLSGIAKGYAVDAIASRLRDLGCHDFLVEIGGELVGAGVRPDGQPWWVDIENPDGLIASPLRIALHGLAIATSGDYRRTSGAGSHTIDPRTGRPIANGVASVSVLHQRCMHADAWASALTVLGPEDGMALAERTALAAHVRTRDGGEWLSPALRAMLV